MKIVFATSLDNNYVIKAYTFLEHLIENKNIIYIRNPIDKNIPERYDIGISFLYQHKIPKSELEQSVWFNFHPGSLPKYKGRNVVYRVIMDNALEFGGTLHYMDENFDSGDIIEVKKFPLRHDANAGEVLDSTYQTLVDLFYKWIPKIINGEPIPRQKQIPVPYKNKVEIDDYLQLDWNIKRQINALTVHPKHHAKIKIGNKIYKVIPDEL